MVCRDKLTIPGAHKAGGDKDCGHCKFWVINQDPISCKCFKNFAGITEDCQKCPPRTTPTGGSGPTGIINLA